MTKDDFEKLIETDPRRDEILGIVKIGLGESKNDEVWYDICAEHYKLCAGNIESFSYNLYKAVDNLRIIKANFDVKEKNEKHLDNEIFLLLVKYEYVEETNSNEYDINTKTSK